MKSKLLAAAATVAALIVPAVALGQTTVQAPTKQCSVTAFGPGFAFKHFELAPAGWTPQ